MLTYSPVERPDTPHVTVVVVPDTQVYSQKPQYLDRFEVQIEWIVNNVNAENIEFVLHEGDLVEAPEDEQFERGDRVMNILDNADVPYLITVGNHDYDHKSKRSTATFDRYFPKSRFDAQPWWGESYDGTAYNSYATFNGLNEPYLVLSLELFPREEVLTWASDVLTNHPDHRTLLLTHAYLYRDGTPISADNKWDRTRYEMAGFNGDELWESFVSRHENISVVCSGHDLCEGSAWRTTIGRYGNPVHQILTNYQTMEDGGRGFLRLLRFYPSESTLTVETYSPYLEAYHENPDHHFRIDDAF